MNLWRRSIDWHTSCDGVRYARTRFAKSNRFLGTEMRAGIVCVTARRSLVTMSRFDNMKNLQTYWFPILCSLIVGVSLYDTFLIVKYSDHIHHMEENPLGRWLLNIADGGISVFVRAKLAGTVTVISVLLFLWKRRSSKAVPVTVSLAVYQTGLLAYLTFA